MQVGYFAEDFYFVKLAFVLHIPRQIQRGIGLQIKIKTESKMKATFRRAHEIRREAAARFGGKPSDYSMSEACKMAVNGECVDDLEKRKKVAQGKIDKMMELIDKGHTIYLQTIYKTTAINSKTVVKFKKAGYDIFVVGSDGRIYMRSGNKYVIADGCHVTYA